MARRRRVPRRSSKKSQNPVKKLGIEKLETRCLLAVQPLPVPFSQVAPAGGLVYETSSTASIDAPGEVESFTVDLDSGQTLSVALGASGSLDASLLVRDPGGAVLATADVAGVGQPEFLQSLPVATTGTYTIEVTDSGSTTGSFDLGVVLNADIESELLTGTANDTAGTAQDIGGAFVALPGGVGDRAAVDGSVTILSGPSTPFDVVGSPLSFGFAADGSFSGPSVGMRRGAVEFLQAGTFLAGYSVRFDGVSFTNNLPVGDGPSFDVSMFNLSSGPDNAVLVRGMVQPGVSFERLVQWSDGDEFAHVTTTIDNQTGSALTGLSLLENFDPDPGGVFSTVNDVTASGRLVVASGSAGAVGFGSNDPGAVVSVEDFGVTDPLGVIGSPIDPGGASADDSINIAFDLGDLAPGNRVTRTFQIVFGNDQAAVESNFAAVGAPPTLPIGSLAGDAVDYFSFSATAGDSLDLALPDSATLGMTVMTAGGDILVNSARGRIAGLEAPETGNYLVRVTGAATQDYSLVVTRNASFDSGLNNNLAEPQEITPTGVVLGSTVGTGAGADHYGVAVSAGDTVVVSTSTPADGPGEFVNLLDPALTVYDPSGAVVATDSNGAPDGRNAQTSFSAAVDGRYTIAINREGAADGEYVLQATGFTGLQDLFVVSSSSVADGAVFGPGALTQLTLDFSAGVRLDTLDADDLLVGGSPGSLTAVAVDGDTVTFGLPALANGPNVLSLPAGALSDLQGRPLEAFELTVTVDVVGPRVVASSLLAGDLLPVGDQSFSIEFDGPLATRGLDIGDVQVFSDAGPVGLTNFAYDAATSTLTFDALGLTEDEYTLRLISGPSAITDTFGNLLDGEPDPATTVPSGDGVPGGDFEINFFVEQDMIALPAFTPVEPLGGLVYESSVGATIAPAGDTDMFTAELDPGQTLSLLLESGIQAAVEVFGPDGTLLAASSAGAAGDPVVLQNLDTTAGGVYSISIIPLGGTSGDYTLLALLNGAFEAENAGGPVNSTPGEAEALSFQPVGSGAASRGAVSGFVADVGPDFSDRIQQDGVFWPNEVVYSFTEVPPPTGDATVTFNANTDLNATSEFLTINAEGLFTENIFVNGGLQNSPVSTQLTLPQATLAALAADGTITFTVDPSSEVDNLGTTSLEIVIDYPTVGADGGTGDWYEFSLDDGQSASIALAAAGAQAELVDGDGTTVLASTALGGGGEAAINGFVDTTTDGTAQNYFVRVFGGVSDYNLVVAKDGLFDEEPNDDAETAQDIGVTGVVLGSAGTGFTADDPALIDVAVLSTITPQVVSQLSAAGMNAASVTTSDVISGSLVSNEVDVLVLGRLYLGTVSSAFVDAVDAFVAQGGGVVTEWDGAAYLFDGFHPTYRYSSNPQSGLFTGQIGAGQILASDTPLTNVASHPVWEGLPPTFSAGGGTEFFYTTYGFDTGQIEVVATFRGNGSTNFPDQDFPAVFVGREESVVGLPFDWQDLPNDPNLVALYTNAVTFAAGGSTSADTFQFAVNQDDVFSITTTTPSSGPGEFENRFDPQLELFDPEGNLVPHANVEGDEVLTHTALLNGTYTVRVSGEDGSAGEYVLEVTGNTGGAAAFEVVDSSLADGDRFLPGSVTSLTVDLSNDVLLPTAEQTDLLIDGSPAATAFTLVDQDTLRFDLPVLANGTRTLSLPAGSLTDLSGRALEAFSIDIVIDEEGPRVVGSSVLEGDILAPGTQSFSIAFDEPLNESVLGPEDVQLFGGRTGAQAVGGLTFDSSTNTLSFEASGLEEDLYTLRLISGPNAFVDTLGNLFDGETDPVTTVPSGDGVPGGDFLVNFEIDTALTPLPAFTPVPPIGGLVYESEVSGFIGSAADIDDYVVELDAGQTLTVEVVGEIPAVVTLVGPDGSTLATSSAAGGETAVLQAVPVAAAGEYTIQVQSGDGSIGGFELLATLNAQAEEERVGGPANNLPAEAEDLVFTPLGAAVGPDRAAVTGFVSSTGPLFTDSVSAIGTVFFPNVIDLDFTDTPTPTSDATLTFNATTDLGDTSEFLTIDAEGLFSQDIFVFGGGEGSPSTTQIVLPQATVAELAADGVISLTVTPSSTVNNFGTADLTVDISYETMSDLGDDWYRLPLADGESTTVALTGSTAGLELYAPDGTTLLAAGRSTAELLSVVENFIDNTADGLTADYFVRVVAGTGDYSLVVTRDAALDIEANNSFDDSQDITGSGGALGFVAAADAAASAEDEDWYTVSLVAGDVLEAGLTIPAAGPGEFNNPLGPGFPGGLIISEVVDGASSDGNPKFVEITNTAASPFTFAAGGLIVQTNNNTDRNVDIDLSGVTIEAGESYVIASSSNGGQAVFESVYGFSADLYADEIIGDGNDRYAITDGAAILDLYGVLDTNGTGAPWEYADGFALRRSAAITPAGEGFVSGEWVFSGVDALEGGEETPEALLQTLTTPGVHEFIPADTPLARVALFDPSGALVEPDALGLTHVAATTGAYRLRVSAVAESGEYFLDVAGATGDNLAPFVAAFSTPDGALLQAIPATFTVTFSEPLLEGEVQPGDLLINGAVGATAVQQLEALTFRFDVDPAVDVGDGVYTVTLPGGAVTDLQSQANTEFVSTFELDATGPRVVEANINGAPLPIGVTYLPGDKTIEVRFDEDVVAGRIDASAFRLVDTITGAVLPAESFAYNEATRTLQADYLGLGEGAYEFVVFASSRRSGIEDLAGNPLDGEPIGPGLDGAPSGDGVRGGDYALGFQIDSVGVGAIGPFTRVDPLGSLIFVSEDNPGLLNLPGDVDDFEVSFSAGDLVSAVVTPTDPNATLSIAVVGLSGPITAPGPGLPAVLPPVALPIDSPVLLRVIGDVPTTYLTDVYLNTSLEQAVVDTDLGNVLSIDDSLRTLSGVANRYAVLGSSSPTPSVSQVYYQDFNLGLGGFSVNNGFGSGSGLWNLSSGRQLDGDPGHTPPNSLYFGQNAGPFAGGDYDTNSAVGGAVTSPVIVLPDTGSAELSFNHFIETDGVTDLAEVAVVRGGLVTTLLSTGDGTLTPDSNGSWQSVTADLSAFSGQSVQLRFVFDSVDDQANGFEGWFVDDVRVEAAGANIADIDEYTVDLAGGRPVDVLLDGLSGSDLSDTILQLIAPNGTTVLATGGVDPLGADLGNYEQGVLGFTPATAGTYTVRVASPTEGGYSLVVTESLVFDSEPNDGVTGVTLRELTEQTPALGYLGDGAFGGSGELFAIDASAGDLVQLDPVTGDVLNRLNAPQFPSGGPDGLAVLGNSLFYASSSGSLYELDATTGEVLDVDTLTSLGVGSNLDGLAAYGGLIVTMDHVNDRLYFVDTEADTAVGSIAVTNVVGGIAGAGSRGSLFASDFGSDQIYEIDAQDGSTINSFAAPAGSVYGLAFVNGALFAANSAGDYYELDPDTGAVLDVRNLGFPTSALAGDDASGIAPFSIDATGLLPPPDTGGSETDPYGPTGVALATASGVFPNLSKDDALVASVGFELAGLVAGQNDDSSGALAAKDGNGVQVGAVGLMRVQNDHVLIDAAASGDANTLLDDLVGLGLQSAAVFGRMVSGWLPVDAIAEAAALASLQFARPSYQPVTNVGATTSQGDAAMRADIARSTFGVDGSGVTIGILSDSYDIGPGSAASDIASGDLPGPGNPNGFTTPVNVLSDRSGSDEGRAMAQLIHDVAPGAELAFHTAFNGQADFASGILELQSVAGAEVIVDDVIYFAEPMFQDGIIAQAIDTVVANGSSYFSSAGNNGRDSWEGGFTPSGVFQSGTELHDFDPGPDVDTLQSITVSPFSTVRLSFQWDSPFFSVSGGAGSPNDLDVFIFDSTGSSLVASTTTNNIGGDAVEVFSFNNNTGSSLLNIAIGLDGGPAPGLMKWVSFDTITVNEYATNSATAYGHANAAGASAVGAAEYSDTPAFGVSPPVIESFSSAGGIPILFDTAGNPVNDLRAKPNITAPDGTNTTFFGFDSDSDGFPNFFGTSAAAPHAAAVAGLMLELTPMATPAEIYDALESTAIDMDDPATPGFDVGFDSGTGHGLVDAPAALALIEADPALVGPRVVSIDPAEGTTTDLGITTITVTFTEPVDAASAATAANYLLLEAGVDGVFESGDDQPIALAPSLIAPDTVELLVDGGASPLAPGSYRLVLDGDSSILDPDGNPLNSITGPGGGFDTVHEFDVVFELPRGGDFYRFDAEVGDQLTLRTAIPLLGGVANPLNDLDAQLAVFGPGGNLIGFDQDSADGLNAEITFTATADGPYTVQVTAESGEGEYLLTLDGENVLPDSDFNRDFAVDVFDLLAWQRGFGADADAGRADGDADGDSDVDADDLGVWESEFGVTVEPIDPGVTGPPAADFDGDAAVSVSDLLAWQRGFGAAGDAARTDGDADGDSDVDGLDLAIWQLQFAQQATQQTASSLVVEPQAFTAPTPQDASVDAVFNDPEALDSALTYRLPGSELAAESVSRLDRGFVGPLAPRNAAFDTPQPSPYDVPAPLDRSAPAERSDEGDAVLARADAFDNLFGDLDWGLDGEL